MVSCQVGSIGPTTSTRNQRLGIRVRAYVLGLCWNNAPFWLVRMIRFVISSQITSCCRKIIRSASSHHKVVDDFPITEQHGVFYHFHHYHHHRHLLTFQRCMVTCCLNTDKRCVMYYKAAVLVLLWFPEPSLSHTHTHTYTLFRLFLSTLWRSQIPQASALMLSLKGVAPRAHPSIALSFLFHPHCLIFFLSHPDSHFPDTARQVHAGNVKMALRTATTEGVAETLLS